MVTGTLKRVSQALVGVLLFYPVITIAGYFDCNVIYDEFDSLMNKQFLIDPGRYVQAQKGRMSRTEFFNRQQGRLHLSGDRKKYGVAIIRTNQNIRGKLLFNWNVQEINGIPPIMIQEGILYGRVYDGFAPQRLRPTLIKPTYFIDIDTGAVTEETKEADIAYKAEDGNYFLEAANGAELSFPVETLCHVINSDLDPLKKGRVTTKPTAAAVPKKTVEPKTTSELKKTTTISREPSYKPAQTVQ
ncbi:hypothetical protein ACFL17_01445 [Pseudomonadota bacterium]